MRGPNNRLARIQDPAGKGFTFTCDDSSIEACTPVCEWYPNYGTTATSVRDDANRTIWFNYNGANNLVSKTREEQIISVAGYSRATADRVLKADTLRTKVTDPRGSITYLRLDKFGAPTEVTAPDGTVTRFARDSIGRLLASMAPNGTEITNTWNGPYLTGTRNAASGDAVSVRYDTLGNVVQRKTTRNGLVVGTNWFGVRGRLDSARVGPDTSHSVTR